MPAENHAGLESRRLQPRAFGGFMFQLQLSGSWGLSSGDRCKEDPGIHSGSLKGRNVAAWIISATILSLSLL